MYLDAALGYAGAGEIHGAAPIQSAVRKRGEFSLSGGPLPLVPKIFDVFASFDENKRAVHAKLLLAAEEGHRAHGRKFFKREQRWLLVFQNRIPKFHGLALPIDIFLL